MSVHHSTELRVARQLVSHSQSALTSFKYLAFCCSVLRKKRIIFTKNNNKKYRITFAGVYMSVDVALFLFTALHVPTTIEGRVPNIKRYSQLLTSATYRDHRSDRIHDERRVLYSQLNHCLSPVGTHRRMLDASHHCSIKQLLLLIAGTWCHAPAGECIQSTISARERARAPRRKAFFASLLSLPLTSYNQPHDTHPMVSFSIFILRWFLPDIDRQRSLVA